jgi:hypothetical protein
MQRATHAATIAPHEANPPASLASDKHACVRSLVLQFSLQTEQLSAMEFAVRTPKPAMQIRALVNVASFGN